MKLSVPAACLALIATIAAEASAEVIASDDFDNPVNLVSYSAVDALGNDPTNSGVWSSPFDTFGPRTITDYPGPGLGGNWLEADLVDESSIQPDALGIVPLDYPGNFFAILDTDNGVNPSGVVTGTWVFDISSATSLTSFEVDMAAIGNFFDNGAAFERFTWSYAIDGSLETELFTVRADANAGPVTYTLDDGTMTTVPGNTAAGDDDNGVTVNGVPLLNDLTTLSAPLTGSGNELSLILWGFVNDNNAGFVFDNIVINGSTAPSQPGDFDLDGDVDVSDALAWQRGESPTPGSAVDLQDWEDNLGFGSAIAAIGTVPEPSSALLIAGFAGLATAAGRRR